MTASLADVQRRPAARRRLLVMGDQAASSLSNILVAILVARQFGAAAFGAFSLAMVAYQLAVGVTRAVIGEALLSLYSHEEASARHRLLPDLIGATLSLSAAGSVALWAVAVGLGGVAGEALGALAVVLPLVLLQDTWRYVFVVDRPGASLALDLVWLVQVVVALPLAPADAGVAWYVIVWGLGGGLGAALGFLLDPGWRGRLHPWRWLVEHRSVTVRYLGETATARVLFQVLMTGLGAIAGLGALGAVRASQIFYGPLNTVNAGVYMAVVPEGAAVRDQPDRLRQKLEVVSLGLAALFAGWMLVGLVFPDGWGRELFGATWTEAESLMLPMGLAMVATALMNGGLLGLRSLADAKRSLRARLQVTPWLGICPLVGAAVDGARGFALGTALGTSVAAAIWWAAFRTALGAAAPSGASTAAGREVGLDH